MRVIRRTVSFLVAAAMLIQLTGCWDSVELNRRAIVSGVAIDKGEDPDKPYSVSFQVIVADEISGEKSRGNSPVVLYTGTGRSMFEALSNASRKVARYLSLGHIRVIVISEEWAREGIKGILDVMERESQSRLTTLIFVSKGQPARESLSVLTVFGRIPSLDLVGKLETTARSFGYNFRMEVDDVVRGVQIPGGGMLINGVEVVGSTEEGSSNGNLKSIRPKSILLVTGLAAFRGDRLIGWLEGGTARGSALLQHKIRQTPAVVKSEENGTIAFNIYENKVKIRAVTGDSLHPVFRIRVTQQAALKEIENGLDLTKPQILTALENELEKYTADQVNMAVSRAKKLNSDYLGFGGVFERTYPKVWKQIRDRWDTVFVRSEIQVEVKAVIRHTDMRTNAVNLQEGEE